MSGPDTRAMVTITVDGRVVAARAGETVAGAILSAGGVFRTDTRGMPRGMFCNMGICGECTVRIGDRRERACLLPVSDGLAVTTHD